MSKMKSTNDQDNAAGFRFLNLPTEIRFMIYELALHLVGSIDASSSRPPRFCLGPVGGTIFGRDLERRAGFPVLRPEVALLGVCQLTHREGTSFLYSQPLVFHSISKFHVICGPHCGHDAMLTDVTLSREVSNSFSQNRITKSLRIIRRGSEELLI